MSKTPTIQSVIESFAGSPARGPELIPKVIEALVGLGLPIDLGPMTPDVRKRFDAITAEARADLKKKFAKPDASE